MVGQLFAAAPELPPGQSVLPQGTSSGLVQALMRQPTSFQSPSGTLGQIPLASLAQMYKNGQQQPGAYPQTDAATNQALGLAPGGAPSPQPQIMPGGGTAASQTDGFTGQPSMLQNAMPNAPGDFSAGNPNGAPWLPGGQSSGPGTSPDSGLAQPAMQATGPTIGAAAPGMPSGTGTPGPAGVLGSLFSGMFGSTPGMPTPGTPGMVGSYGYGGGS